jgi:Putative bacterial sensory transduction regulator
MGFRIAVRVALLGLLALPLAAPAPAQTNDEMAARLISLMKTDGYDYHTTRSPTVFTIHFQGSHMNDIKVVLTVGGDQDADLIVFVTVTEKRRMPVTTDFMRELLEQNHKLDQVKIGFDADGDLEVRIDAPLRLTDAAYLQSIVTQVKSASDDIYGKIEPSLLP